MVRRMTKNDIRPPLASQLARLQNQISTIIKGKPAQISDCVACLIAGGHLLIEDLPGVGKTTLAHALSISMGLKFSRLQFTADLMPSRPAGRQHLRTREAPASSSTPARCSPRCCWPTRSTAPARRRRAHCWRRWRRTRSASTGASHAAAAALLRHRHAEPQRAAGHLPAARVAAGPLPDVHLAGLPRRRGRARAADRARTAARPCAHCSR